MENPIASEKLNVRRVQKLAADSPWILRVTEHKDKPAPVLIVKERHSYDDNNPNEQKKGNFVLRERGLLYGQSLRYCLPVIRDIIIRVCDPLGVPLELQRFLPNGRISFRGNLPLDEESGAKLALMFKLQERIRDMDRVELIARRVALFSREEAEYWYSRATQYGLAANRWAQAGMRTMLGGQPGHPAIEKMLERLRK